MGKRVGGNCDAAASTVRGHPVWFVSLAQAEEVNVDDFLLADRGSANDGKPKGRTVAIISAVAGGG